MRALVFILAALVLAGCSPKTQKPAEAPPPEAKAPAFPPALIRETVGGIKTRCDSNSASSLAPEDLRKAGDTPAGAVWGLDLERICPDAASKGLCGSGGCENPAFLVKADGTATTLTEGVNRGWEVSKDGKTLVVSVHGGECGLTGPSPCKAMVDIETARTVGHEPKPKVKVGDHLTEGYCLGLHVAVSGRASEVLGKDSSLARSGSIYTAGRLAESRDKIKGSSFQHDMKNGAFAVDNYLTMGRYQDNLSDAEQLGPGFKFGSRLFGEWYACAGLYPLQK